MAREERLDKLTRWLGNGRCVARDFLLRELEVSHATLKRDITWLKDRRNLPIEWDRDGIGWRLDRSQPSIGPQFELPGLSFAPEEIHALLSMQHLLSQLDAGGFIGPYIEPLMKRLNTILGTGAPPKAEIARRIRARTVGARKMELPHFQAVGSALLRRLRLVIEYRSRERVDVTVREVSPQRLVHYRDNWYLDAWCHWRNALRSFSVDAIERVRILDVTAIEVPDTELDELLGAGYGIFAGRKTQQARLRFSPDRSRWVSAETWHPDQRGRFDAQGRWNLDLPYADPRELVMDILRHVPEVEVLWPEELQEAVHRRLSLALAAMSVGGASDDTG